MKKQLHIDYISFQENEQVVSYAPQLKLCFNAPEAKDSLDSLKCGTEALLGFWKSKNILDEKIKTLGLNGTTTPEQREQMERDISVPYYLYKKEQNAIKSFDLNFEV